MKIIKEDVTDEVSARILKAEAKKYDIEVVMDSSDRKYKFNTEDECNDHILKDVVNIFKDKKWNILKWIKN